MRKINLFWKTWIMSFCSLVLTGCVFVISYSYLTQRTYEQEQINKLKEYKQAIYDEISINGIRKEVLEKYPLQGCFINVLEGRKAVYPIEGEGFLFHTDMPYFLDELELIVGGNTEYLQEELIVKYQGHVYTVTLMLPRMAYSYNYFWNFLPTFAIVGFIATGMISFLYSLYFSRRIKRLNNKMQAMSKMEYEVNQKKLKGDELIQLELQLNEMYLQLRKVLNDRIFFTRGVTHELKTPIMAVLSMLEGMLWEVDGFEDRNHYLQECYLQMEQMIKLVNELLNLSQVEQLQEGTTNLLKVMNELILRYEVIAQDKNCEIVFKCDDEHLDINILENNLNKVLSNLLSNALKYAPDNSIINIEIKEQIFSISNECLGLENTDIIEFFEPFVQGENAKEGHGLGLYLVKTILNAAGIKVECLIKNGLFIVNFRL